MAGMVHILITREDWEQYRYHCSFYLLAAVKAKRRGCDLLKGKPAVRTEGESRSVPTVDLMGCDLVELTFMIDNGV